MPTTTHTNKQYNPLKLNNPNLLQTTCLIGDGWHSAKDGATFDVKNPFDGTVIAQVPKLSLDEINSAIDFANTAQKDWAKRTAHERANILQRWATLIDDNKDDLATILTTEQGKPLKEAVGEITYGNDFIKFFAEEAKRVYGDVIPTAKNNLRYVVSKEAIGVCAAITPWNFPSAMITRKVAPALAAGCAIIVKPAGQTPLSALALGYLARQAGIPAGVLQIITAKASVAGQALTQSPIIKKLSFTGSTEVGKKLMKQSADTLKKLSLELGGNAPFIVFDDADLDKAVDGLIICKHRNAGQVCTAANRIYVHNRIKDDFIRRYQDKVAKLSVGNGLDNPDIGAMINDDGIKKAKELLQDALDKGANVVLGGDTDQTYPTCFRPTIITDVNDEMAIAKEEIFAPITAIYGFDDTDEVIRRANDTIYGLAAYFYTQDLARSWQVMEGLQYGMVGQNTGLISNAVVPFGGVKQSGFGREGSKYGIDEYVVVKYWCIDVD